MNSYFLNLEKKNFKKIGGGVNEGSEGEVCGGHRRGEVPVTGGGGEGLRHEDRVPLPPLHRYVYFW